MKRALVIAVGVALLESHALADIRVPSGPLPGRSLDSSRPAPALVRGTGLTGSARLSARVPSGAALRAFSFHFEGSDHEIKAFGALQEPSAVTATFQDNDGNDKYTFYADYAAFGGALPLQETSGRCQRGVDCYLPIRTSPDHVFALAGFKFSRVQGDANVEEIAIDPDEARRQLKVIYKDRAGFPFDATVQYVLVPRAGVSGQAALSGRRTNRQPYVDLPLERAGYKALQGFSVRFTDADFTGSDHHLRTFSIEPGLIPAPEPPRGPTTLGGGPSRAPTPSIRVTFNDKNYDDRFAATVKYLTGDVAAVENAREPVAPATPVSTSILRPQKK